MRPWRFTCILSFVLTEAEARGQLIVTHVRGRADHRAASGPCNSMTKRPHSPPVTLRTTPQPCLRLLLAIGGDNTHRSPGPVYSLPLQSFLSVLLVIICVSLLDRRRRASRSSNLPVPNACGGCLYPSVPCFPFSEWLRELSII